MLKIPDDRKSLLIAFLLAALILVVYVIRLTGAIDLEADAQQRNLAYVMDAAWRGNWLVQTEVRGWLMSKPPLHTWLAASFGTLGGINRLTLTLPSALAVFGMAWLAYRAGRRYFGATAGIYAGLACALAPALARHVALVRTDAVFAFAIMLAALAAHHAWERGRGWVCFWLAAAAATLTKGPLGLILAAVGLLAYFWERRDDPTCAPPYGFEWRGLGLFFALTLGWLGAAILFYGPPLIDKLFFEELFGQVTGMRKDITPGENLAKPSFFFILRFLPFSLFACYGLWRVARQPAVDRNVRRFERFLFLWIVVGLLLFSFGAHFRADLLLPLWPAAAMLAGREMAHLGRRYGQRKIAVSMALLAVLLVGLVYWSYHPKAMRSKEIQYSVAADQAGRALAERDIDANAILHLDTPPLVMMHLGVYRPWVAEAEILTRVRNNTPVCIAVTDPARFPKLFEPQTPSLHRLFRWPEDEGQPSILGLYANAADAPCMRSLRHVRDEPNQ